jgi:predicted secreted protein
MKAAEPLSRKSGSHRESGCLKDESSRAALRRFFLADRRHISEINYQLQGFLTGERFP